MKNNYSIYKHTAPNGKVYIGLTGREPKKRWNAGHAYKHSNPHFWSAIKKYGWDNIKHEILLSGLNRQQASEFEKMYISFYNSTDRRYGYNKTYGGEVGSKPTEETILKFSGGNHFNAKRIEQYSLSGEYIKTFECVSNAARELGVNYTSIASCARHAHYKAFGYIWVYQDEPHKEYWIKKDMKDYNHGGNNPRARKIIQYDMAGNYVKTYSCLTEASKQVNVQISRISDCANGNRLSASGYIWLFEDDESKDIKLKNKIAEKTHSSKMCGGANHQARAIEQYDINGHYIRTFDCAQDAATKLNIDYSTIKQCASKKGRAKSAGGYIWIHADEINKEEILKARMNKGCEKPVSQYTVDGEHIRDFASITEAKAFLNTNGKIGECARGERKTACGYVWKFA